MGNVYGQTEAASRYDAARALPSETKTLWLDALKSCVPQQGIKRILDLGCGTGRFSAALGEAFGSLVVGLEPSAAMLEVAVSRNETNVEWRQGQAESIPLESQSVDLVFMSQVFHHLVEPRRAMREIRRVLTPTGYLAIRNGTREHNRELRWLDFFPGAYEIEEQRTPSSQELSETVFADEAFQLISHRTIQQLFAASYTEYYEKVSRRGLSALIAISDEEFQSGAQLFRKWTNSQPRDLPVYEPVDLFVFQKNPA